MEDSEAAFFVSLPDGTKLTVGVFPNPEWMGKRLKFDSPVRKTDFNVYVISRASLVEVYGSDRGLFAQSDMSVSFRQELGNVITATLSGGHKLGIYPLLDKAGKKMTGMYLWVE
jgi:hypothetical protein